MRLLTLSFFFLVSTFISLAQAAEEVRLNNQEIKEVLIGNTAVSWDPEWPYRQYFGRDFETVYAEKGKRSSLGNWKTGDDLYCSLWAAGEWECYKVFRNNEGIVWAAELNEVRYPARVLKGERLLQERRMTGEEIKQALTGNTAVGTASKPPFRQLFLADGTTAYADGQRPTSYGLWNVQGLNYCSEWDNGAWSCYEVYQTDEGIVWVGKDRGDRYPAKVLAGDQLINK